MKKVKIESLTLVNFKGIKNITIPFDVVTNISGDNATGKTTIVDAFQWLLFGKNSQDVKDFNIKTLTETGEAIHRLEHSVECVLYIDDETLKLKRVLKEKWIKKRGEAIEEFTGHETSTYYNDVPCNVSDFQKKISEIIDEKLFKLLTSVTYFNSLKKEEKRQILTNIAGNIDVNSIFDNTLLELHQKMTSEKKTIAEVKAETSASISKLKKEIEVIPPKIQELELQLKQLQNIDKEKIQREIDVLIYEINKITTEIEDSTKIPVNIQEQIDKKNKAVFDLSINISEIESKLRDELIKKQSEINNQIFASTQKKNQISNNIELIKNRINSNKIKISIIDKELQELRIKFTTESEKTFNDDITKECPTCKRLYDIDMINEQTQTAKDNFNLIKVENLENINKEGVNKNELKSTIELEITKDNELILKLQKELAEIPTEYITNNVETEIIETLAQNKEYNELKASLEKTKNTEILFDRKDVSTLREKRTEYENKIDFAKTAIARYDVLKESEKRVKELETEYKELLQKKANLERLDFQISNFNKKVSEMITNKVNQLFKYVNFRMFNIQINGGIEETCVTLINGVPYDDANGAAKINAGLDIINTLSNFYKIQAPVFIDNAESVTQLIDTECQSIRLIVEKGQKILKIS